MATAKKANIFDTVKRIMTSKDKWENIPEDEKLAFSNWMCNKVISMNSDYCEVVDMVQKNTWILKPEHLYKLYCDLLPKGFVFSKYIKSSKKKDYKMEEVKSISIYYDISTHDAKEYIDVLPKEEVERITQQINMK